MEFKKRPAKLPTPLVLSLTLATGLSIANYVSYFSVDSVEASRSRIPASVNVASSVTTLEASCDNAEFQIPDSVKMVRVQTQNCDGQTPKVTNQTNQHTASVFQLKNGLSTDYITLNEGTNTLELVWPQKTVTLTINRL